MASICALHNNQTLRVTIIDKSAQIIRKFLHSTLVLHIQLEQHRFVVRNLVIISFLPSLSLYRKFLAGTWQIIMIHQEPILHIIPQIHLTLKIQVFLLVIKVICFERIVVVFLHFTNSLHFYKVL